MSDGKHHFFKCSKCEAPLMDACIAYADESINWNVIVNCPHCNGRSDQQTIKGVFYIGHTEESEKYTAVDSFDMDQDPIVVNTIQVKKYVK